MMKPILPKRAARLAQGILSRNAEVIHQRKLDAHWEYWQERFNEPKWKKDDKARRFWNIVKSCITLPEPKKQSKFSKFFGRLWNSRGGIRLRKVAAVGLVAFMMGLQTYHENLDLNLVYSSLLSFPIARGGDGRKTHVEGVELPRHKYTTSDAAFATELEEETVLEVEEGENLQTALTAIQTGGTLVLEDGALWTAELSITNIGLVTDVPIRIISETQYYGLPGAVPENVRVLDADSAAQPRIHPNHPNVPFSIYGTGKRRITFVGVNFENPGAWQQGLVRLTYNDGSLTLPEHGPGNITFDRCSFMGNSGVDLGTQRGLTINYCENVYVACCNSKYIYRTNNIGSGDGSNIVVGVAKNVHLWNNRLHGGCECLFLGSPGEAGGIYPMDVSIIGNLFEHEIGQGLLNLTKNHLEWKSGTRNEARGNVHGHHDGTNDGHAAVNCKSNTESGGSDGATRHIVYRYNKHTDSCGGMGVYAQGSDLPTTEIEYIYIGHNDFGILTRPGSLNTPWVISFGNRIFHIVITNNVGVHTYALAAGLYWGPDQGLDNAGPSTLRDIGVRNNILSGDRGLWTPHYNVADAVRVNQSKNAFVGVADDNEGGAVANGLDSVPALYTQANLFRNHATDRRLAIASPWKRVGTDGKDLGPNWSKLDYETRGAVTGVWS